MVQQKKALLRLHFKIAEVIREIDAVGEPSATPLNFETTDFRFRLDYEEKRRAFRLIKSDGEIIGTEEEV